MDAIDKYQYMHIPKIVASALVLMCVKINSI